MKIKVGDQVKVLSGKDSGKQGKVEKIYPSDDRLLIAGVNEYKRHIKARSQNQKSEIITITKPINVASVALVCPKCKKITRIAYKFDKDNKKLRICAKCKKGIE